LPRCAATLGHESNDSYPNGVESPAQSDIQPQPRWGCNSSANRLPG